VQLFFNHKGHKVFHRGHKVFSVFFVHSLCSLRLKLHKARLPKFLKLRKSGFIFSNDMSKGFSHEFEYVQSKAVRNISKDFFY